MLELFKKSILASIGAAVVTRDAIMEATKRLVNEGKMSIDDAEKLADSLVDSGKKQWDELHTSVSENIKKGLDSLDLGGKREFQDLRNKVDVLEKRLAKVEEKLNIQGE